MKTRQVSAYRDDARAQLAQIGATIGQDYHTLTAFQVGKVEAAADFHRYRKPRGANGSRCRYYFALLQRRAK